LRVGRRECILAFPKFSDHRLEKATFTGEGCTISQATASMLTGMVTYLALNQIQSLDFHTIEELIGEELVKTRPKCSNLALDTLRTAAEQYRKGIAFFINLRYA
jgi:nitrogen fixation NifU-like protein